MKHKHIILSVITALLTLVFVEIGLRLLVRPSNNSYGVLFNKDLPPFKLIPSDIIPEWESGKKRELFDFKVVDGKKLRFDDFFPILRDDPLLGFTVGENYISTNGWRHSNNFGARSSEPLSPDKPHNRERVLFFGDSYTAGATIPQDQTIIHYLNEKRPDVEFVNFGVEGYSTGQAFLRFRTLKDKLEFDRVFLVFVPNMDLWRDINVNRYIGGSWAGYYCYNIPVFVIEGGKLELIPPPYGSLEELFEDNRDSVQSRYREHLRKYDNYYSSMYESVYLLDNFVVFKLLRKFFNRVKFEYERTFGISESVMDARSEAQTVTKGIIDEMGREAQSNGARFSLIVLPTDSDIRRYKTEDSYKKSWDEMTRFICSGEIVCYDFMDDLSGLTEEELDTGNDGTHYGPKTNERIADLILEKSF
ncbi:MAG: SGNH/GDSL hydrolase family protein [Thermodesulfobacteriota bacterium]